MRTSLSWAAMPAPYWPGWETAAALLPGHTWPSSNIIPGTQGKLCTPGPSPETLMLWVLGSETQVVFGSHVEKPGRQVAAEHLSLGTPGLRSQLSNQQLGKCSLPGSTQSGMECCRCSLESGWQQHTKGAHEAA
jgi:hypothetical protein